MKVGILGASGAVGRQMITCLEERDLDIEELRLFGSGSVGKTMTYKGKEITIEKPHFEGLDYVLGATSNEVAKQYKDEIIRNKAIFIDNSSAFRHDVDVPLVIPEINSEDLRNHKGVIANPNCSTIITLMAIYGINQLSKIKGIIASTYQAVSGAGVKGIAALQNEVENYVKNNEVIKSGNAFEYPIAFNCIPKIGSFNDNGYTSEEMKMENEGRKIMHLPDLKVTCTCVRVPVMRSHCISVTVITEDKLSLQDVRNKLSQTAGIILKENVGYPMPYTASDKDMVEVGRIREDRVLTNGISLWCCGDQIRKGAASNAIQIMETLAKM